MINLILIQKSGSENKETYTIQRFSTLKHNLHQAYNLSDFTLTGSCLNDTLCWC